MFKMPDLWDSEMAHYDICNQYHMSYLHYVYHQDDYINMSMEELITTFTAYNLRLFDQEMKQIVKNIASLDHFILPNIDMYGLLDYIEQHSFWS